MKQKKFLQYILLNGEFYGLETYKLLNLEDLILYFSYSQNLIVLEYNEKVYNSSNWYVTKLNYYDKIETIAIVGGG